MNEREFNRLFLGEFTFVGRDYPELKKENNLSGIYSHECTMCKRMFYGYKRRILCFDCDELSESRIMRHTSQ